MAFREVSMRDVSTSPIQMIKEDWMLITAGTENSFNTMTASWGAFGELWNKDAAFIFVRPVRYTYEFLEKEAVFSLSFFDGKYKKELGICGSQSGRDVDKMAQTGFTPLYADGTVYFEEAELVVVCKKIAFQDIDSNGFLDESIESNYPNKDYHRMYVGEILKVLYKDPETKA